MKTLCLYYTRTNTTKEVMETISKRLDADLYEYSDGKDRSGFFGYVGACFANVKNTLPTVLIKGDVDLKSYDRVIIAMPIWAEKPCAVGRAMITKYCDELPKEVFFVFTHMGKNDYVSKVEELEGIIGRPSSGHFSVKTKDNDYIEESNDYAAKLI